MRQVRQVRRTRLRVGNERCSVGRFQGRAASAVIDTLRRRVSISRRRTTRSRIASASAGSWRPVFQALTNHWLVI